MFLINQRSFELIKGQTQRETDTGFGDFQDGGGGANLHGGSAKLLFGKTFPENCMKMKEF